MTGSERMEMTKQEKSLREYALSFPESSEHFPWGHRAFKVKKKIFMYLHGGENETSMSFKLPVSRTKVLRNAFASPTHYGMGAKGWVTCKFDSRNDIPIKEIKEWVRESYCAIAPKTLVKRLEG